MAIDFYKTGESIMQLAKLRAKRFTVKYDRNGIENLVSSELKLPDLANDVFVGCKHPILEISAKPKKNHYVVNMLTKDRNEVITDNTILFSKDTNVLEMLPDVIGKSKKIILGKKDTERIIMKNFALKQHFLRPLLYTKNPNIEIASKQGGKFDIAVLTLKDGDEVIARGAYSKSIENGAEGYKFHFYSDKSVNSGYMYGNKKGNHKLELLPKSLATKVELLGEHILSQRDKLLIFGKYALGGAKRQSEQELAKTFWLTKVWVHNVIMQGLDKVKAYNVTPEMINTYKKYADIKMRYLPKDSKIYYQKALQDLLSHDYVKRADAERLLEDLVLINKHYANKRIYNVIHDIPEPKEAEPIIPSPITDIWVSEL